MHLNFRHVRFFLKFYWNFLFSVKYRSCIVIVDCFVISFTFRYFFYGYTNSMDWYDRILVIYIEINAYRIIFTQIFAWSCWITDSICRGFFYVSTSFDRLMISRTIAYIFNSNSMQSLVVKKKCVPNCWMSSLAIYTYKRRKKKAL